MSNLIPVSVVIVPAIAAGTLCLVGLCSTLADKRRIKILLAAQAEWKAAAKRNAEDGLSVANALRTSEQNVSIFKKLSQYHAGETMKARALVNAKNFQFTKFIEAIWGAPALPRRFVDVVKYIEDLRAQLADALRTATGLAEVVKRHDAARKECNKAIEEQAVEILRLSELSRRWEKQAESNATILMTCIRNRWAIIEQYFVNEDADNSMPFIVCDTANNMRTIGKGDSPENAVKSAELGFTCPEERACRAGHEALTAR